MKLWNSVVLTRLKISIYRARENIVAGKSGQNWKLDKIGNGTKLKIGQNLKMDKIENWTKFKNGQN